MSKNHLYSLSISWTGNLGTGTSSYRAYSRDHVIRSEGKPTIPGSSDPAFRGDPGRYNPEELFVSTLSSCHMLWMLHLCASHQITVVAYDDQPEGLMIEREDGSGYFKEVVLRPRLSILEAEKEGQLSHLHEQAHKMCFIANSVKCEVKVIPTLSG